MARNSLIFPPPVFLSRTLVVRWMIPHYRRREHDPKIIRGRKKQGEVVNKAQLGTKETLQVEKERSIKRHGQVQKKKKIMAKKRERYGLKKDTK